MPDPALEALRPGLEMLGMPAYVVDTGQRYRILNAAYEDFFGRRAADMIGHTVEEVFGPAPADDRRTALVRALTGETLTFDRDARHGPNAGRWIRLHYMPIRSNGAVVGVTVVLTDIQHLKDAQSAIAARERQLSLITDTIGFPVTYIDKDCIVRFANAQSAAWAGLTPMDMIGTPYATLAPPEVVAKSQPLLDRALGGESVTYEREALWPGRETRRVRGHMIPDKDESGTVRGAIVVLMDIEEDHRLQESLLARTRELQLVTENVGVPMAYIGADRRYRFANTQGMDWLPGITVDNIVGKTIDEVYPPSILESVGDRLGRAMAGERVMYERLGKAPDGSRRWMRVNLIPDRVGEEIHGAFSVMIDIDDDKRLREALERQERQLRFYAENIPEAIAFVDADLRYQFVNKVFERIRGASAGDIVGRSVPDVLGEEDFTKYFSPYIERLKRGEACTFERLAGPQESGKRWFQIRLEPHMADDGAFAGFYIVGADIHDLKLARERLEEQEAQLRAREEELRFFAENIPEAIVYIDLERGCTFVNNVFLASRGITREHALGKFPRDVYPPDLVQALKPHLERVERGESVSYERRMRISGKDEERWVRVKLTPRKNDAGRVLGYYVVSSDVHDLMTAKTSLQEKERELRQVIDSIPTPMVYVDAQQRYRYANDAFLFFAGRRAGEVVGRTVLEVLGAERHEALQPVLRRVLDGETVNVTRPIIYPDGRGRWMSIRYTPRHDGAGRVLGYYATTSDIHEQKAVEEELRRANSILSAHFDNTPLAVVEWNPDMKVTRWSGSAESIFGWSADEVLGRPLQDLRLVYEEDAPAVSAAVQRLVDGTTSQGTTLNRNYRKDGSVIWTEWHNSVLRDSDGTLMSILSLAQDVSSRIQSEERLQFMATHDGLTGLPNRLLLPDRLSSAISRAQRFSHGVAVLFLDLDHFKDVNDTFGHRVGDELLKSLARRVRGTLRQSDLLVRLSGDEFVIVLEDLEGDGGTDRVAQKILDDVLRPFTIEGQEVQVSASLGYAVYPDDGNDPETLLKNADAAMYHAKEMGRNSYRAFSRSLAQRRDQRLGLEVALKRAIRQGEFELYYQPILDVVTGHVAHAEALVRWHDPARGLVLPPTFIPVAEEAGLMRDLGHWVFEAAARQAAAWNSSGTGPLTVSVNLSASQLRDSTIIAELEAILAKTGCAPTWLTLEITETSMVKDVEGVSLTLRKLRRMGFRIAIDDFGTGFSSLSHLRHLPVDTLKIDKSFVADINGGSRRASESGGAAIVAAVTGLARGLGLDVVAEGVERESQLAFLREQGCASFQGFLALKPVPAAEFERWLAERSGQAKGKAPSKKKPAVKKPKAKKPAAKK
ncbi:MAG: PAS domain-containing protein [Betaproteobacteria bacterium]|nr:PAS domain-containing protein [Betaproteobacteria bacterium]